MSRVNNDYTEDFTAASELRKRLEHYYHSRGYSWIRVWLEPQIQASGSKFWFIRSNIVFRVPPLNSR